MISWGRTTRGGHPTRGRPPWRRGLEACLACLTWQAAETRPATRGRRGLALFKERFGGGCTIAFFARSCAVSPTRRSVCFCAGGVARLQHKAAADMSGTSESPGTPRRAREHGEPTQGTPTAATSQTRGAHSVALLRTLQGSPGSPGHLILSHLLLVLSKGVGIDLLRKKSAFKRAWSGHQENLIRFYFLTGST